MSTPAPPSDGNRRVPSQPAGHEERGAAGGPAVHTVELPTSRQAPSMARRWLMRLAAECGLAHELLDDAALILSELVNNVIDHTDTHPVIRLEAICTARRIWVSVLDHSRREPIVRATSEHNLRGRGMLLVDRLASRWGTQPHQHGKRVWAELALA